MPSISFNQRAIITNTQYSSLRHISWTHIIHGGWDGCPRTYTKHNNNDDRIMNDGGILLNTDKNFQ